MRTKSKLSFTLWDAMSCSLPLRSPPVSGSRTGSTQLYAWNLQKCDFFGSAASLWCKKTIKNSMRKTCQNFARYLEKTWFCLSKPWFLWIWELFPRRYELSNHLISNENQGFERQNYVFSRYLAKFWHVELKFFSMVLIHKILAGDKNRPFLRVSRI